MNIGQFTKNKKGDLTGSISTFGAQFDNVTFEAIDKKGNGPDYIITTGAGELGAAWEKTSKAGNKYLSVSFSGPFLPETVYAALTKGEGQNVYNLVWSASEKND